MIPCQIPDWPEDSEEAAQGEEKGELPRLYHNEGDVGHRQPEAYQSWKRECLPC